MNYQFLLQNSSFRLTFTINRVAKEYLDLSIEFVINPSLQAISIRSVPNYITTYELHRLLAYFDEHLKNIAQDSYYFMPLEVGFQLQAQQGQQDEDGNGYIALLILLNVGFDKNEYRLYAGGQVIISFAEIAAFMQSIRVTLNALQFVDII